MTPLPKTKSVLIVGAGPAGLVAAKTFKQYGYTVAVYEAADCVGGMWRTKRGGPGDKCSYDMHTNLSRFTVSFSDLSWSSVDLEYLYDSHRQENPPMFPMAWQVGEYLKTYAKQFDIMSSVHLQKRVSSANVNKDNTWDVSYVDASGQLSKSRTFDYLIVANGYFDKPAHSFDPSPSKNLPNIQHSSRFRDLSGLTSTSGKVVVIGGGISGSEAASQAAFQISNAQYAPSETKPAHAASKVYHVINRPFYCLPRYLPTNPRNEDGKPALAPKFLPIDLILHDISRRGSEVISAAITTMPPEKAQKGHAFIRDCLGGDQRDVGHSELVYKTDQTQYPAYTGITDTYKEFVRSGILVPVQGQVEEVKQQVNSDLLDVSIKQSAPWQLNNITSMDTLNDVVGIVEATGYKSDLDWLDPHVQDVIGYNPSATNPRIPLSLSRGSVFCSRAPTIGFIGFYAGPYWGVMEAQAHLLAKTWTNNDFADLPDRAIYKHDTTRAMQEAIKNKSLQVPQFWMGDYVGLMEELSREAGTTRSDSAFGDRQAGPIFPARYQYIHTGPQAQEVVKEVAEVLRASEKDLRFVASAAFTAMQGMWNIHRPVGTFRGTGHFHPREPTDSAYDKEYLYIEKGTITSNGVSAPSSRRYVYRFNSATETITVWHVHYNESTNVWGDTVEGLMSTWEFYHPVHDLKVEVHGWMARGECWCGKYLWKSSCDFRFTGARVATFMLKVVVEEPQQMEEGPEIKQYIENWYSRTEPDKIEGVDYTEENEACY